MEIVLDIHLSSVAHNCSCELQKKDGYPIQSLTSSSLQSCESLFEWKLTVKGIVFSEAILQNLGLIYHSKPYTPFDKLPQASYKVLKGSAEHKDTIRQEWKSYTESGTTPIQLDIEAQMSNTVWVIELDSKVVGFTVIDEVSMNEAKVAEITMNYSFMDNEDPESSNLFLMNTICCHYLNDQGITI
jgi:hypothetical protein